ncbi:MAG: hypothetical protein HRU20_04375 [Pseudomonadales bacterium]|nr:hypothetical protein [Pseudomonadales bacterium]
MFIKSRVKQTLAGATVALTMLLSGCFEASIPNPFNKPVLGVEAEDYAREGMSMQTIEAWEDGLRTDMQPGSFEWWYFDAELDNGTKVVVVFFTKEMFDVEKEASPRFSIDITLPGQETFKVGGIYTPEEASFSKEGFNVTMGPNFAYGDLDNFVIHAEFAQAGVVVDFNLERTTPSWRPANGHWYFNRDKSEFFAWLPSVPKGKISGELTVFGQKQQVQGSGYHDHNWGNANMSDLFSNWWWSRGDIDGKTVIAAELRTRPAHASQKMPIFMVADENGIIADASIKGTSLVLNELDVKAHPDSASVENIAHQLLWQYENGEDHIEVLMSYEKTLNSSDLLLLSGLTDEEIALARFMGMTPWYSRFFANADIHVDKDGNEVSSKGFAVMEKMDFE